MHMWRHTTTWASGLRGNDGNGNTERENRSSYSTESITILFCSFLVRLLHAGQSGD